MPLDLINPLNDAGGWNRFLQPFPAATIFHTAEWAMVLSQAYGYDPHYSVSPLPVTVVEVATAFNRRRGVCVPFADSCQPLVTTDADRQALAAMLVASARQKNWAYVDLRGSCPDVSGSALSAEYWEHSVELDQPEAGLLNGIHDSHRRNIRKAIRHGVEIDTLETRDAIEHYYRLHCLTRKRLGVPPQPLRFFRLVHQHLIARGMGVVLLARYNNRYIAGAVCLHFGRNAIYKFAASDAACQHLRPNNLVLWEAIRYYRAAGAKALSLGRTGLADQGLRRFKSGWGATESMLAYRRIPIRDGSAPNPVRLLQGLGPKILRRMPVPVLRTVGALVYPHLG